MLQMLLLTASLSKAQNNFEISAGLGGLELYHAGAIYQFRQIS